MCHHQIVDGTERPGVLIQKIECGVFHISFQIRSQQEIGQDIIGERVGLNTFPVGDADREGSFYRVTFVVFGSDLQRYLLSFSIRRLVCSDLPLIRLMVRNENQPFTKCISLFINQHEVSDPFRKQAVIHLSESSFRIDGL